MKAWGGCLLAGGLLTACAAGPQAAYDSLRLAIADRDETRPPALNPALRYLRVGIGERSAYLALGYVETAPAGTVEVWYSAKGEVLKLQNGRIVGSAGLEADWREVRTTGLPRWADIPASGTNYQRERDLMPGYRAAVHDSVHVRPITVPARPALPQPDLRWFEEASNTPHAAATLPPARFAVDLTAGEGRVVYSEQCLSETLCLTLQPWNAVQPTPAPVTLGQAR